MSLDVTAAARIPESISVNGDSIWLKAAAFLPVVGSIVEVVAENMLGDQAKYAIESPLSSISSMFFQPNRARFIKAVEIKNQYKVIGIVRDVIVVAALITLIALGIFSLGSIVSPLLLMGFIAMQAYRHYKNSEMLADVRSRGEDALSGEVFIR